MCELSIHSFTKKVEHEKQTISQVIDKSEHWNHLTLYIDDVWIMSYSQFQNKECQVTNEAINKSQMYVPKTY